MKYNPKAHHLTFGEPGSPGQYTWNILQIPNLPSLWFGCQLEGMKGKLYGVPGMLGLGFSWNVLFLFLTLQYLAIEWVEFHHRIWPPGTLNNRFFPWSFGTTPFLCVMIWADIWDVKRGNVFFGFGYYFINTPTLSHKNPPRTIQRIPMCWP